MSELLLFYQVVSVKPVDESLAIKEFPNGMLYEDADCAVMFSFWAKGGDASFEFYNKTDKIIYLDMKNCFFIKNGVAYDYFHNSSTTRTQMNTYTSPVSEYTSKSAGASISSNVSGYYAGNFGFRLVKMYDPYMTSGTQPTNAFVGYLFGMAHGYSSTYGTSQANTIYENSVVAIPPKTSKIIAEYSINNSIFVDCDLLRYPSTKDGVDFDLSNTPLTFSNFITFKVGENGINRSINPEFYVYKIENYSDPEISIYLRRQDACVNTTDLMPIENYSPSTHIYDKYVGIKTSDCFYLPYNIFTNTKIYQNPDVTYNYGFRGYTFNNPADEEKYNKVLEEKYKHPTRANTEKTSQDTQTEELPTDDTALAGVNEDTIEESEPTITGEDYKNTIKQRLNSTLLKYKQKRLVKTIRCNAYVSICKSIMDKDEVTIEDVYNVGIVDDVMNLVLLR